MSQAASRPKASQATTQYALTLEASTTCSTAAWYSRVSWSDRSRADRIIACA